MLLLIVFTILHLTFTTALPAKHAHGAKKDNDNCTSDNFVHDWVIRDIFLWEPHALPNPKNKTHAKSSSNNSSDVRGSIDFIFFDTNQDLELQTECFSVLINGATPDVGGGYNRCKNDDVWFKFTAEKELLLERFYTDPCLGSPPYDGGIAYGQKMTGMPTRTVEGFGLVGVKTRMRVPITSMS